MTQPTRIRLSPERRRVQLLDLGTRLLGSRTLDDLTVDLLAAEAGVSRGLLYHYFGSLTGYRLAVVKHAVDELVTQTAPPSGGDPVERLLASVAAYVDYVAANEAGYRSLVRAAAAGTEEFRALYDEARAALVDRVFEDADDVGGVVVDDTPAHRLAVQGWAAMVEEATLAWVAEPAGVDRETLLRLLSGSLPAMVALVSA